MNIKHAIVHLLEKKQLERAINLQLREDELERSDQVIALLDQIRRLYNTRSGRGYGEFEPERFLTRELRELGEGRVEFVEFTRRCMADLSSRVAEANLATGGYVIFVEYEQQGIDYLMIVMLKSTPGMTFDRALEILDVEHLDLNRLHFAARVNLTEWNNGGTRYISFVKGRATDISSYFKAFIGVTEYTEASENTRHLVNVLGDYCSREGLPTDEADELKTRVHSYCINKAKAGDSVLLEDLSTFIDEERPAHFLEYANERQVSDEIELDRSALRPLVRYYGKDADVSISFKASAYRTRVTFQSEEDTLTIHPVPPALRAQLAAE